MRSLVNLIVLVLVVMAAHYGYTNFKAGDDYSTEESSPAPRPVINCRGAKASLARLTECRAVPNCTLTTEQETELRELETDIERFCN
ncbi:MAG: hypothetical protein P8X81_08445 [Woeseiaceae bacterium]